MEREQRAGLARAAPERVSALSEGGTRICGAGRLRKRGRRYRVFAPRRRPAPDFPESRHRVSAMNLAPSFASRGLPWRLDSRLPVDTFVGFDSAWTDNPRAPGAITAVSVQGSNIVCCYPPRLVSFDGALAFIREVRSLTMLPSSLWTSRPWSRIPLA